jgi:hypothetical protein
MHTFAILAGLLLMLTAPSHDPGSSTTAQVESLAQLSHNKQDKLVLASLGVSPESLAACGFSAADASSLLGRAKQRGLLGDVEARMLAMGARVTSPGTDGVGMVQDSPRRVDPTPAFCVRAADFRARLLASTATANGASRRARLDRCISGARSGLPAELAAACLTDAARGRAAAALQVERRAERLGRAVPLERATILADLRNSAEFVEAAQGVTTHAAAIARSLQDASEPPESGSDR